MDSHKACAIKRWRRTAMENLKCIAYRIESRGVYTDEWYCIGGKVHAKRTLVSYGCAMLPLQSAPLGSCDQTCCQYTSGGRTEPLDPGAAIHLSTEQVRQIFGNIL